MALPPTDGYGAIQADAYINYTPTGESDALSLTISVNLLSYPVPVEDQHDNFLAAVQAVEAALTAADPTGTVQVQYMYHGKKAVPA